MKYEILFTRGYTRRAQRFIRRHPELRQQYRKTLQLLELKPFHPSLRLRKLRGSLEELHSVSINLSYRVTIEFLVSDRKIIPVDVGSHETVY